MAYDEGLAHRIRELLGGDSPIQERKMFGGLAFLLDGRMSFGIIKQELMVRVGPEMFEEAAARPHARPMDFTGRPMRGFVQVAPAGFEDDADLRSWIERGMAYSEEQTKNSSPRIRARSDKGVRKASRAKGTSVKPLGAVSPRREGPKW